MVTDFWDSVKLIVGSEFTKNSSCESSRSSSFSQLPLRGSTADLSMLLPPIYDRPSLVTSLQFQRSKLALIGSRGVEIMDLESMR